MRLHGNRFQPTPEPPRFAVGRVIAYCAAILVCLGFLRLMNLGILRSPFAPPPTPTRSAPSYAQEGEAFFNAGQLEQAIRAYQNAVRVEPGNPQLWSELARIQTYSSALIVPTDGQAQRMSEARDSIQKALDLDAEYGLGYAIRTLVLDWSANSLLVADAGVRQDYLNQAYQSSIKALQLEPENPIALAFKAEVLADQANWAQALDEGARAVQVGPQIMDVHRAYAYVLESNGYYEQAIEEYLQAVHINPNLPFLYMSLGVNYRKIGESTTDRVVAKEMIANALDAFDRASSLDPSNPGPYLSIANTYARRGDFFAAERNAEKALSLDPQNAAIYGRLGAIYYQAKNYETAIKVLKCAVRGCTAEENELEQVEVTGLPLAPDTLDFYYIYGSVLAFYGGENSNYCPESASLFTDLRASPWNDATIEAIMREGERICASYSRNTPTPQS